MPSIPNSIAYGILNLSESQDAAAFSKCQRNIRKVYERNRKRCVYRLNLKQPKMDEDKYTLAIKKSFLQLFSESYSLDMNELKNKLLQYSPTSLKFEISDLATTELLDFLPKYWFDSVQHIEIRCMKTDKLELESIEAMKRRIMNVLRRFGTIDNIMFKPYEISTSGHDYMQYLCWWIRRQKIQTKGFRIKYEKLNITGTDVELRTARLSKYFHLWMDWSASSPDLEREIRRFLSTTEDDNNPPQYMLNNKKIIKLHSDQDIGLKMLFLVWLIWPMFVVYSDFSEKAISSFVENSCWFCFCLAILTFMITKY